MTTTGQALTAVRTEVGDALRAMRPRAQVTKLFRERTDDEMEQRPIRECAGADATRLFEIDVTDQVLGQHGRASEWIGCGTVAPTVVMPIRILYPLSVDWMIHAHTDAQQIADYLRSTDSFRPAGTGCELRVIEGMPEIERLPNEPWFVMTLNMHATLDVQP